MNVTLDLNPHNQRMVIWVGTWETYHWSSLYPCITNLVLGTCFVADIMEMRGPKVHFTKNAANWLFHLWLVLMYSLKPTSAQPSWLTIGWHPISSDQAMEPSCDVARPTGRWTCQRRCEPDTTQRETGKTFDVGAVLASEDGQRWYWKSTGRTLNIVVSERLIFFVLYIYNSLFGRLLMRTTSSIASVMRLGPTMQDMSGAPAERDGHLDILR